MGISVSFLFLALGLIHPINMSFPVLPEDLEGSGYDLESSGSGDWSQQGGMENSKYHPNSEDVRTFTANAASSVLNFDGAHKDNGSGFVVVANSKSFLENKEIFAALIAGGVTGVALAAALAALLIYRWQKKDNGGYILGQQRASDVDYYRPDRAQVVV